MKHKNLKRKIIDGAIKLFAEKGFYETTVDDIAKRAKIAKGTVYLYFKNKPSLYITIIDEHFTDGIKFLKEIQEQNLTSTEKLKRIASEWLNYMIKFKNSFPMFSMENVNLTKKIMKGIKPIMFSRLDEIIDIIAQIVKEGIKDGEFRKTNPRLGAMYFLNIIRTAFISHVFYPDIKNPERDIGEVLMFGLKRR